MASTEHLLISKVIQQNEILPVVEAGLKPQHFSAQWSDIWEWVVTYWRDHSAVPSERAFNQEYGNVSLVDASREQFSNLIEELITSYRHQKMVETLSSAVPLLNENETQQAINVIAQGLQVASADTARILTKILSRYWSKSLCYPNASLSSLVGLALNSCLFNH